MLKQFKGKLKCCPLCEREVQVYMNCASYTISCCCGLSFIFDSTRNKGYSEKVFIDRWNKRIQHTGEE